MLRVSDFTYVATGAGFVCAASVIDTFAGRTVGWWVSRTAHASFVVVAGGGLSPSIGAVSPTFTVLALADRAAAAMLGDWAGFTA